jgi:hypothetical protein
VAWPEPLSPVVSDGEFALEVPPDVPLSVAAVLDDDPVEVVLAA